MRDLLKNKALPVLLLAVFMSITLILISENASNKQTNSPKEQERQEQALATFLEQTNGVDEVHLRLCIDENGKVTGAAVICSGGDDPIVSGKVIRLLSAALGLSSNRIEVCGKTDT